MQNYVITIEPQWHFVFGSNTRKHPGARPCCWKMHVVETKGRTYVHKPGAPGKITRGCSRSPWQPAHTRTYAHTHTREDKEGMLAQPADRKGRKARKAHERLPTTTSLFCSKHTSSTTHTPCWPATNTHHCQGGRLGLPTTIEATLLQQHQQQLDARVTTTCLLRGLDSSVKASAVRPMRAHRWVRSCALLPLQCMKSFVRVRACRIINKRKEENRGAKRSARTQLYMPFNLCRDRPCS